MSPPPIHLSAPLTLPLSPSLSLPTLWRHCVLPSWRRYELPSAVAERGHQRWWWRLSLGAAWALPTPTGQGTSGGGVASSTILPWQRRALERQPVEAASGGLSPRAVGATTSGGTALRNWDQVGLSPPLPSIQQHIRKATTISPVVWLELPLVAHDLGLHTVVRGLELPRWPTGAPAVAGGATRGSRPAKWFFIIFCEKSICRVLIEDTAKRSLPSIYLPSVTLDALSECFGCSAM